jgi:hypothetical protein
LPRRPSVSGSAVNDELVDNRTGRDASPLADLADIVTQVGKVKPGRHCIGTSVAPSAAIWLTINALSSAAGKVTATIL